MLIKHQCPVYVQFNAILHILVVKVQRLVFNLTFAKVALPLCFFFFILLLHPHTEIQVFLLLMVAGFLTSHPGWCCCHIQPLVPLLPPSQLKIKER